MRFPGAALDSKGPFIARELINQAGLRVHLTGKVFELCHPCIVVIVRIVENGNGLHLLHVPRFVTELDGTIR